NGAPCGAPPKWLSPRKREWRDMRALTPPGVGSSEPTSNEPAPTTSRRELWSGLAALTPGLALLDSLGSYQEILVIKPTRYSILLGVLLALTLALAPRGLFRQVRWPKALVAFIAVMLASYLWSSYRGGFFKGTNRDFVNILAVVICGQLLCVDRYF